MQVDVVRHFVGRIVFQVEFNQIAFANPDKLAGDGPAKGPELKLYIAIQRHLGFLCFHLHNHLAGMFSGDGRRHSRGLGKHRFLFSFHHLNILFGERPGVIAVISFLRFRAGRQTQRKNKDQQGQIFKSHSFVI